jgi:peptidoglycan hydrolase CwlO-like protein
LEQYVLRREKDRLEKEIVALTKRKAAAERQFDCITKQIERLQKEAHEEQKTRSPKNTPMKHPKSMAINY